MATLSTSTTNFNQTVVAAIQKQLEKQLRAGLGYMPAGSILPGVHVPGTNATFRALSYSDLAETKDIALAEGVWTLTDEDDIGIDFVEFTGAQYGHVVRITDLASYFSAQNLFNIAAEKISRSVAVHLDSVARAAYLAATAEIFAGSATSDATLLTTNILTGRKITQAAALLKARDVPPLPDGNYCGVASPFMLEDLMADTAVGGWLDSNKYTNNTPLMEGEVGRYGGVRFVTPGSRGGKVADQVGPVIASAGAAYIAATDTFTATSAHGLVTGDRIKLVSITGGAGLVAGTIYYVIVTAATTFKVATTLANALAGTAIDITSDSSAQVTSTVRNIYKLTIIGQEALFMGDVSTLQIIPVTTPDSANPLNQYSKIGWKIYRGAALNKVNATDSGGTDVPRFLNIAASTTNGG